MVAAPSDKPTVRAYEAEDRGPVITMLADRDPWRRLGYTESDWQTLLTPPLRGREGWVLERAGEAAGIALVRLQFLRGDYLELFAVAPGCERQGLGRLLLAEVEHKVFARTRNLFVCVSDFNHVARRFYARSGYQQIGALGDLLTAGSAELLLRKTIDVSRVP
jgi:[ribosomal protein S18]-alanine N-acetyltransferase